MRSLSTLTRLVLGAMCLFAVGCTPTVPVKYYVPEPGLTAANAATVTGSKIENSSLLAGDLRIYVTHIDSAVAHKEVQGHDETFLVKPGTHYLRIFLRRHDTWRNNSFYAQTEQFVELEAGKIYIARGELKGREATLWLDEVGGTNEQARADTGVAVVRRVTVVVPIVR